VPNERVIRWGNRGDAVYFIASGAVEVRLPMRCVRLGSGEFFGEMALLTGRRRQADVVALTYADCSCCAGAISSALWQRTRKRRQSSIASRDPGSR
jgi:CRP-like cAMP-binding protein